MNTSEKIRCPKCTWQPEAHSSWSCLCGHSWNTFDTGGQCPSCGKQWEHTQCLSFSCLQFSLHIDWYEDLDEILEELMESIDIAITVD